jgi:hypothetical protein
VTYFASSEDAMLFLDEMTQVNSGPGSGSSGGAGSSSSNSGSHGGGSGGAGSADFRLNTVSLEKVMNQIMAKKQSRKLGRMELDLIHRIQVPVTAFIYA